MRANTSLIGHILGSNPQISGYYEMHINYSSACDLETQQVIFASNDEIKSNTKYLFDKLLHNKYQLLIKNFDYIDNKILVSLRSPEQSIKSILNLFRSKNSIHPYADVNNVIEYYIGRITFIANFCANNKLNYYYYDADLIRTNTRSLLNKLNLWLELGCLLQPDYEIFSQTGKSRAGDSSKYITQGKICNIINNYDAITIPKNLLSQANDSYSKLRSLIINNSKDSICISTRNLGTRHS
jgi:hypothetical protein